MKKINFYLFYTISKLLPTYRFYKLRRKLLILSGLKIGLNTKIAGPIYITQPNIEIGDNVWIGPNVKFYVTNSKIIIEKNCDIAPDVIFITGTHKIGLSERRAGEGYEKEIIIKNGSWIGVRSLILGGTKVGEKSIIAAGTIMNHEVNANSLIAGIKGRVKRELGKGL